MNCKCWGKSNVKVTFKSPKKTISMCIICANKHYKSLVNGHRYKVVKIENYNKTEETNNQRMKRLNYIFAVVIVALTVCYFTFRVTNKIPKVVVKHTHIEYSQKKVEDWSKEPNENKKAYMENLYNTSTKSE